MKTYPHYATYCPSKNDTFRILKRLPHYTNQANSFRMEQVSWKVFIQAPPSMVFRYLSEDSLREKFWAEKSQSNGDCFELDFPNGVHTVCRVIDQLEWIRLKIEYFNSIVLFELSPRQLGTELKVTNTQIPVGEFPDFLAGWVSVLLSLKAAIQFNIDLRNHDPEKCWDQGFVDN